MINFLSARMGISTKCCPNVSVFTHILNSFQLVETLDWCNFTKRVIPTNAFCHNQGNFIYWKITIHSFGRIPHFPIDINPAKHTPFLNLISTKIIAPLVLGYDSVSWLPKSKRLHGFSRRLMWLKKIFANPLRALRLCGKKPYHTVLANPHFPIDINARKTKT